MNGIFEGVNTTEVCRRTGLTFRQLDRWERLGAIAPSISSASGSGSRRLWSDKDIDVLCAIKDAIYSLGFVEHQTQGAPTVLVKRMWEDLRSYGVFHVTSPHLTLSVTLNPHNKIEGVSFS